MYDWIWEGKYRQVGLSNPFGAKAISEAVTREAPKPRVPDLVSGVDVAYTLDGDWTAVVTVDEAGNEVESQHFRIEEPEERHEAIYALAKDSFRVLVDTTEAAGKMAWAALRARGVNVSQQPFNRQRKHTWVTYAARRLQEGRATLRGAELVRECRLFSADGKGQYEASVGYDDLVCAWLLALEGLRQWEAARGR